MRRVMEWVVGHPVLALLVAMVATAAAGGGVFRLEIDASARGLLVPGSADKLFYDEARETFGDDVILSVVLQADDVFRTDLLQAIQDLTLEAETIDGVSRVVSLATVSRLEGDQGFLNTDDLLAYVPEDDEELAELRRAALGNELLLGEVVSRDGEATAVHLFLEARPEQVGFEEGVVAQVEAMLEPLRARLGEEVRLYQVGNPYLKQSVMDHIRRDLMVLAPTCTAAILLVLFFVFRSVLAMVVPAVTGLLSVIVTLGVMGYLGLELTPVTVMIPSLLIIIGCTEDIHLIAEYGLELRNGHAHEAAVRGMASKSGLAILLTSLTTFIGFATIVPNRIPMLADFGAAAAIGILVNFALTVLVVPAVLRLLPAPAALARPEKQTSGRIRRVVLGAAVSRPGVVIAAAGAVVVVFSFGSSRLAIDTNYLSFFREDSEVQRLYRDVSENLVGALSFLVVVDSGEEGRLQEPRVLRDVAALTDFLAERFDKVLGYPDYLRKLNQEMNSGDPAFRVVPDSQALVSQLELMLDPDDLDRFADFDRRRTAILVRTSITGSKELGDLVREIDAFVARELSRDLDVHVTGESILIAKASDTIARELLTSLSWVLVAIFAFISLLFYSFKAGLLAMVPNLLPVLVNFGFMGLVGIPLSTATFPVAMIALGIAVDDTIHFMVRFAGELKGTSDNKKALTRTIVRELRPVLTTSTALAIGFSTLLLGQFASTVHFGLLAALAMASALLADLFVTPVLLKTTPLISAWDLLRLKINDQVMARSPLFQGLKRGEVKRVALLGDLQRHAAGDFILRQNDEGEDLLVLLSGKAQIEVQDAESGRTRRLHEVEAGDVVGEMAFFTKAPRSASVIALEDVESLQVDGQRLERVQSRFPRTAAKVYYNLSKLLSTRLGQATVWLTKDG